MWEGIDPFASLAAFAWIRVVDAAVGSFHRDLYARFYWCGGSRSASWSRGESDISIIITCRADDAGRTDAHRVAPPRHDLVHGVLRNAFRASHGGHCKGSEHGETSAHRGISDQPGKCGSHISAVRNSTITTTSNARMTATKSTLGRRTTRHVLRPVEDSDDLSSGVESVIVPRLRLNSYRRDRWPSMREASSPPLERSF